MVIAMRPEATDLQAATVARAQAGEPSALTALIEQHERPLYHFILSLVRQSEDASDVAQDVWLQVATRLPQLRDANRFTPWLYQIARNRCLWLVRTRKKTLPCGAEEPVEFEARAPTEPTLEQHVLSLDERRKVWEALGTLSQPDRTALFLRDQLELPYDEVAEVLSVSRNAAQVRVFRARERFRQRYQAVDAAAPRCEVSLLQLGAFVDGGISPEGAAWVREHLGSCDECNERVVAMHEGRRLYRQLGLVASPSGLLAAVIAQSQLALGGVAGSGVVVAIGWKVAAAVVAILAVAVSGARDVPLHLPSTAVEAAASVPAAPADFPDADTPGLLVLDAAADGFEAVGDEADSAASPPAAVPDPPSPPVTTPVIVTPAAVRVAEVDRAPTIAAAPEEISSEESASDVDSTLDSTALVVEVGHGDEGSVPEQPAPVLATVIAAVPQLPAIPTVTLPRLTPELATVTEVTEAVASTASNATSTASEAASTLVADVSPVALPAITSEPAGASAPTTPLLPPVPTLPVTGGGLATSP